MKSTGLASRASCPEAEEAALHLDRGGGPLASRLELDSDTVQHDLARLVLSLVEVIRQLIERQALRRVEAGHLTDEQVERLGMTLMGLEERMEELKEHFGVTGEDLRLDLGALVEDLG